MTRTELRFADGRTPRIDAIFQELTYRGLVRGYPNQAMNAAKVKSLKERALTLVAAPGELPIYVHTPMTDEAETNRTPFGPPKALPSVTCVAALSDRSIGDYDDSFAKSALVVGWFTDRMADPVATLTAVVAGLTWRDLAEDFEV